MGIASSPASTRCPRVTFPAVFPPNSTGTTTSPSSASSQRTGRTNRSGLPARLGSPPDAFCPVGLSHTMFFAQ